jgi:hypothetical protein
MCMKDSKCETSEQDRTPSNTIWIELAGRMDRALGEKRKCALVHVRLWNQAKVFAIYPAKRLRTSEVWVSDGNNLIQSWLVNEEDNMDLATLPYDLEHQTAWPALCECRLPAATVWGWAAGMCVQIKVLTKMKLHNSQGSVFFHASEWCKQFGSNE